MPLATSKSHRRDRFEPVLQRFGSPVSDLSSRRCCGALVQLPTNLHAREIVCERARGSVPRKALEFYAS
jgi:hypothetical protein